MTSPSHVESNNEFEIQALTDSAGTGEGHEFDQIELSSIWNKSRPAHHTNSNNGVYQCQNKSLMLTNSSRCLRMPRSAESRGVQIMSN